jgi:hypothetical protein
MTKRDYIWVAIKIFGLYLLVEAIIALPLMLSSGIYLLNQPDVSSSNPTDLDRVSRTVHLSMLTQLFNSLFRVIICGAFGIYFVKSGDWFLKLICPPNSEN